MKVLSLFSGVGGFDLGLEKAGMTTVGMCEWDKKASSVLRRHWPHIPIYGDISDLTGDQLIADGVLPDLVAFGSPCQDLSVAGKRAGLTGERSGLFHEAVRIIRELRDLTNGSLPRWIIWENVGGALTSNKGADFQAVLDQMGDLGSYFSEWAIMDAQNFGIAQRRRRVFLISCLDSRIARGCPDPLLPLREGSRGDIEPIREAWEKTPGRVIERARENIIVGDFTRRDGFRRYGEVAHTLQSFMGTGGNNVPTVLQPFVKARRARSVDDHETWKKGEVSPTLNVSDNGGEVRATVLIGHGPPDYAVRRLLPLECERLMGWPDDWTRWDADGNEQADSHRYKQTGNGVASPVAEWVGRQIFAADAIGRAS